MSASRTVKFETAVSRGLAAIKSQTKAQWTVGDLALTVDTKVYGAGTVQKFSDEIGMPYKTVMDLRKVASRYDASERSELNSHSIHQIFAGQEDRAELVKAQKWTASAARDLLKSRKGDDNDAGDGDGDNGDNAGATDADPRVKLVANVERLTAELAKATAALAAYDAEHGTPATAPKATAPKATAPKIDRHVGIRGIPAHDATAPREDCPKCKAIARVNGTDVTSTVRHARTRKSAAVAAK